MVYMMSMMIAIYMMRAQHKEAGKRSLTYHSLSSNEESTYHGTTGQPPKGPPKCTSTNVLLRLHIAYKANR
jgi:hypothetical protein